MGSEADDMEFTCTNLALLLTYMKMLREDIGAQIRDCDLRLGMTRERTQEAIYGLQLMEAELLAAPWEKSN